MKGYCYGLRSGTFSSISIAFPPGQGWSSAIVYDANDLDLNVASTTPCLEKQGGLAHSQADAH